MIPKLAFQHLAALPAIAPPLPGPDASGAGFGTDRLVREAYHVQGLVQDADAYAQAARRLEAELVRLEQVTRDLGGAIADLPRAATSVGAQDAHALADVVRRLGATIAARDPAGAASLAGLQARLQRVAAGDGTLALDQLATAVRGACAAVASGLQGAGDRQAAITAELGNLLAGLEGLIERLPAAASAAATPVTRAGGAAVEAAGALAVAETRLGNQGLGTIVNAGLNTLAGGLLGWGLGALTLLTPLGAVGAVVLGVGAALAMVAFGPGWLASARPRSTNPVSPARASEAARG